MFNVKRRCNYNLNEKSHDLSVNNNNNVVKGFSNGNEQKFCLQHNNCNCTTAEVCVCVCVKTNKVHSNLHTITKKQKQTKSLLERKTKCGLFVGC